MTKEAVEKDGEVFGCEVCEGHADDGSLGAAIVCVAELDALEAFWGGWGW